MSSNDEPLITGRRPSFLGSRTRHKKTFSRENYAFPNEYSIPTIPLPPQEEEMENTQNIETDMDLRDVRFEGDEDEGGALKPPQSPARFRRRTTSEEATLNKNENKGGREISVRFEIPDPSVDDLFLSPEKLDIQSYPMTSTPNPSMAQQKQQQQHQQQQSSTPYPSRIQQQLDEEADAFESTKSFLSTYQTQSSPSRGVSGTPRFRRQESPSKLLRTLSRATATPSLPVPEEPLYQDVSQYPTMPTPALKGRKPMDQESDDEMSVDEAERTLDEIISSADEASMRIRRVLENSRLGRLERQSLSPPDTRTRRSRQSSGETEEGESVELDEERKAEMSVWGEKSFFRRMARKAPGGWAFTPQPKYGRTVDFVEEVEDITEDKENVKVSALNDLC